MNKQKVSLRSIEDLTAASEFVFNQVRGGAIDQKTADVLNTTLKNAIYLRAKLRLDALKIYLQAQAKKVAIPAGFLPEGVDTLAAQGKK